MEFLAKRRMGALRTAGCLVAFLLLYFAPQVQAQAAEETPELGAQKVKAGLVYNFLKYTKWQKSPGTTKSKMLKVCFVGGDPFDGALNPLQGRTAQQLIIDIVSIDTPQEMEECNLAIIHKRRAFSMQDYLEGAAGKPILTLSDIDGFSNSGGIVELAEGDERIKMRVNVAALQSAGLSIEHRLLQLAERVSP